VTPSSHGRGEELEQDLEGFGMGSEVLILILTLTLTLTLIGRRMEASPVN